MPSLSFLFACTDYNLSNPTDKVPAATDTAVDADTAGRDHPPEDSGEGEQTADGYIPGDDASTEAPVGRVATILLTLSDDRIPEATASKLMENTVNYVTGGTGTKVLVIRDDATGGEDDGDPQFIVDLLNGAGFTASLIDEPSAGIDRATLAGYHTVVLSNPGHPPDDHATIAAMRDLSTQGFGIVFQGDDMTRFADDSDTMEELTRLRNLDNGESYYGIPVDNDGWITYTVTLDSASPIAKDIADPSFEYANDIDTAEPLDGNVVAAECTITNTDFPPKPAITLYAP